MPVAKNISEAIVAVMNEVGAVEKTGENTQQNYKYVGEKDVVHAVRGAMVKNGLSLRPVGMEPKMVEHGQTKSGVVQWRCDVTVVYELRHTSGEAVMITTVGSGVDTQDKAPYKAMTGAYKYAIFHTFAIERADADDAEKHSEETAPRQQPQPQQQYREPPRQQQAAPRRGIGACPKCGGQTWDNRQKKADGAMKPNAPDFKCKDAKCGGVIWPQRPSEPDNDGPPPHTDNDAPPAGDDGIPF